MLTLNAPAKINWCLFVIGKRPDGYHEIWSIIQKVSLYDILKLQRTSEKSIEIITEPDIGLKSEENLAYKAAMLLKEHTGYTGGAKIYLKKHIPMQAGLGGGSADAAYTLIGLNKLWGLGLETEELIRLSARIGSDVPFFLSDSVAVVSGRGEKVKPIKKRTKKRYILLVKPDFGVSTRMAYEMAVVSEAEEIRKREILDTLTSDDTVAIARYMKNDLEPGVFKLHPLLEEIKIKLLSYGASGALMSGSGSTVFGLFENRFMAEKAKAKFNNGFWCRIVETI